MAPEVVRKESASLVEFLNKISFWRWFGLNLKQKVIIGRILYVLNVQINILMSM